MDNKKSTIFKRLLIVYAIFFVLAPIVINFLTAFSGSSDIYYLQYRISDFMYSVGTEVKIIAFILIAFFILLYFKRKEERALDKETDFVMAEHLCKTHTNQPRRDFNRQVIDTRYANNRSQQNAAQARAYIQRLNNTKNNRYR